MEYNHKNIEAKWQKYWKDNKTYKTETRPGTKKFYVLDMFPYRFRSGTACRSSLRLYCLRHIFPI